MNGIFSEETKEVFSRRLNLLLNIKKLSNSDVKDLCEKKGYPITRKDIYKYTTAISMPTFERLNMLADALNTNPLWLLGYETDKALSSEEVRLVDAWRKCSATDQENIAFMLRNYGMYLESKKGESSIFA